MKVKDITERLREYAAAVDKDRGHDKSLLTGTMRDAANVIDEQDKEIVRLQSIVDASGELDW